ncbi:glycosyltransferase [Amycolatopsis minnesotensis]|uniref:Glycosyltransferase n=1 Tax=Amycolatopsis minnesotensis TaxID=337894 RepID=A0ABN2QSW8_9PSEU
MRILIAAVGTRGDVAPYTGLGLRLRDDGHAVSIAAYKPFEGLVTGCGLEFRPLPGDPADTGSWTQQGASRRTTASPLDFPRLLRSLAAETRELLDGLHTAARGADLLLLSMPAVLGVHVAEGLGVPSMGVFLQPTFPTRAFPPSVIAAGRNLGGWGNLLAGHATLGAMGWVFRGLIRELRHDLGLSPLTTRGLRAKMARWPVLHGYSPALVPRPPDWRDGLDVTGFWWPVSAPEWTPPGELADFLAAGPPPVFVGFGSRALPDAAGLTATVCAALRRAGRRGIIQAGWANLNTTDDDMLTVGEVPHEWLFPRTAALVHHAGAGTTAAGLRAGVPAVPVPVLADQPFWAARLARAGAGTAPLPLKALTADRLAASVRAAVHDPRYRERAEALGRVVRAEDGAGLAAAKIAAGTE